jgi:hypothetical protein
MFALVLSGPMLDRSAAYLSKRNQGLFEPEFRLIANIPAFICFAIGAFGWTWSISKGQHYIVTAVYLAFLAAGASFGTIGSISYAMALFPSRSGDAFGLIMLTKGFYAWSTTLYLAGYFASAGPWHWGLTQGGITLVSRMQAIRAEYSSSSRSVFHFGSGASVPGAGLQSFKDFDGYSWTNSGAPAVAFQRGRNQVTQW